MPCWNAASSPRVRFLSGLVLDGGRRQQIGWESRRKCDNNEGEQAEHADCVRPSCVGDGDEADPGHQTGDCKPRQEARREGSEQRARPSRLAGCAFAAAEGSAEHESEEQRERGEQDCCSREHSYDHGDERVPACGSLSDR
jgi:hypothetical protein